MKHLIFYDDGLRVQLLPLCYLRPIASFRLGILTIEEKWQFALGTSSCSYLVPDYISEKYPLSLHEDNYIINSRCLPNQRLTSAIQDLKKNQYILSAEGTIIAMRIDREKAQQLRYPLDLDQVDYLGIESIEAPQFKTRINRPFDIFSLNGDQIKLDYAMCTHGKTSQIISKTNRTLHEHQIFIEEGASVEFAILNASEGPIYIGKGAKVLENAVIKGPFALGKSGVVKMGAKIYANSSIGPHCKVGGELNNVVMQGYSNKGHDGFLGNSVIGEWCNIGADSNNSNLKNNYTEVKLWDYNTEKFEKTGLQFCGLIMGDHSKCGINTMFNTGTVVGIACNIFGSGYPRNFIPSFAWGGHQGFTTFQLKKVFETARLMMERRKVAFTEVDQKLIDFVFRSSAMFRNWEK